jgi:rubrerythrin
MDLANFGAVLTHAIAMEERLASLYRELAAAAPDHAAALERRAVASDKRARMLERTRRENVTEMILEPIQDFASADYALPEGGADDAQATARRAAQVAVDFYTAGAGHLSIPEVKRIFQRLAKEHTREMG